MHFEPRLWIFTAGVRLRILWAVLVGLERAVREMKQLMQ